MKIRSTFLMMCLVILALFNSLAYAQAPTFLYQFNVPAFTNSDYSTGVVGISADGKSLYWNCHDYADTVAKISIPSGPGTATMLASCAGPNISVLDRSGKVVGGVLETGSKLLLGAYGYYDASSSVKVSHWYGSSLAGMTGPAELTFAPPILDPYGSPLSAAGFVSGWMSPIPTALQASFGGADVMAGNYGLSIVNRTSFGPPVVVFKSADLGVKNPVPATMVLGFPVGHEALGLWGCGNSRYCDSPNGLFNGTEHPMLGFPIPGTDRYVTMESRSSSFCYGEGTSNQALDRQPNPAWPGEVYCYDPLSSNKGNHGYPRKGVSNEWSLAEMAQVFAGTKKPWDLKPKATYVMADSSNTQDWGRGAFDPVSCKAYIAGSNSNPNTVRVYQFVGCSGTQPPPPPPPPPTNCVGTWAESLSAPTPLVCDATQVQTRTRTRTFTVVTPEANGGTCIERAQSPVIDTVTSSCVYTPPPPPPTPSFDGRVRAQSMVTAGLRLTLEVNAGENIPSVGATVWVQIGGKMVQSTIFDVDLGYYAGTPRGTRVILTVPGVSYLSVTTYTVKPN